MECQLRFAPLPTPHSRSKSFLIGWGLQAQLVLAVIVTNAMFPKHIERLKKSVVVNLVPPVIAPEDPRPVNRHVAVQTMQQPILEIPAITKLVVSRQVRTIREPQASVSAPEIELTSKTPELATLPNLAIAKIVVTDRFTNPRDGMPRAAKSAAQVQTGSFGDPNSIPTGDGKHGLNIAAKADVRGAGFGDGHGGGVRGVEMSGNVVQLSGFDKQYEAAASKQTATVTHEPSSPVEIIGKPKPSYTEEARNLGIEGEVRLEVEFTFDGHVHVLRVLQGLGFGLDEQALRCAEQIRFKPATHDGQPIDSKAVVHIVFELAS